MSKPVIKFKTYRQSAAVGGKIYGVPYLGDPVVAEVTMQEVIDYAKLHNFSADTLSALLSQVISGVADLVARDGRPRMLSDLLKFEPVIKGTFDNLEQGITNQSILVRPRMLKELKLALDPAQYSWQNENDKESPTLYSVAPDSTSFDTVSLAAFLASIQTSETSGFGWSFAGKRLCPNGWDSNCSFDIVVEGPSHSSIDYHFGPNDSSETIDGCFNIDDSGSATENTFSVFRSDTSANHCWWLDPTGQPTQGSYTPVAGDFVVFKFTRTTSTGDTFTVQKRYELV